MRLKIWLNDSIIGMVLSCESERFEKKKGNQSSMTVRLIMCNVEVVFEKVERQ